MSSIELRSPRTRSDLSKTCPARGRQTSRPPMASLATLPHYDKMECHYLLYPMWMHDDGRGIGCFLLQDLKFQFDVVNIKITKER